MSATQGPVLLKHYDTVTRLLANGSTALSRLLANGSTALIWMLFWWCHQLTGLPANTWPKNNVIMTSKRRCDVVLMSLWRYYCVMCPLGCDSLTLPLYYNPSLFGFSGPKGASGIAKARVDTQTFTLVLINGKEIRYQSISAHSHRVPVITVFIS